MAVEKFSVGDKVKVTESCGAPITTPTTGVVENIVSFPAYTVYHVKVDPLALKDGHKIDVWGFTEKCLETLLVAEPVSPVQKDDQNTGTGIKHDNEKPDMSLLSSIALIEVARVMTFGKTKYSAHNWRGGFKWSRVLAAAMRHLVYYIGGEDKDPETGLSHLAHCACCIMFLLEFEVTHKELDDRHKGNVNASNK